MSNEQLFAAIAQDASPAIAETARAYPGFAANDLYNLADETDIDPARAARLRSYGDALLTISEAA